MPNVSNQIIDQVYDKAMQNGAIGGKILGAGNGGFMLFICKKNYIKNLKKSLEPLMTISLRIDNEGSQIIYQNN